MSEPLDRDGADGADGAAGSDRRPAPSRKAERKQRSHEAILASAGTLLRERGIRASSVQDVMKGAGLTVGGFYGHFESKEELFAAVIRSEAEGLLDRLLESSQGGSAREKALDVVRKYLSRAHRDHPEQGCLLPSTASEVAREGEPYRGALEARLAGFTDSLSRLLAEDGTPEGARGIALGLIALMAGGLSLARAVQGTPLSDEILRAAKALGERVLEESGR